MSNQDLNKTTPSKKGGVETKPEVIQEEGSQELANEVSKVSQDFKKRLFVVITVSLSVLYALFYFFSDDDEDYQVKQTSTQSNTPQHFNQQTNYAPPLPQLPDPPKLQDITPAQKPEIQKFALDTPEGISKQKDNNINLQPIVSMPSNNVDTTERDLAKRRSAITVISRQPEKRSEEENNKNAGFTYRGNMYRMLSKGKILDATVETAINTDFGGEIRAIISHDIYSAQGRNLLLPKGTKVFGVYNTSADKTHGRVDIIWQRIDFNNGYTLNLDDTPGVDNLGRKGNRGTLDQRFKERLASVIMKSTISTAFAYGLDKLIEPKNTNSWGINKNIESAAKNIISSVLLQNSLNADSKRMQICSKVLDAFKDKTSDIYNKIKTTCDQYNDQNTTNSDIKLSAVVQAVNVASDELLSNNAGDLAETNTQEASKQTYKDIQKTVESFVSENNLQPTVTINQGTKVKIYITKDFEFPKQITPKDW